MQAPSINEGFVLVWRDGQETGGKKSALLYGDLAWQGAAYMCWGLLLLSVIIRTEVPLFLFAPVLQWFES